MQLNEKQLIEQCRKGDVSAFEHLISLYDKKVYNIALRMLGNKDDASELAQEVFIRIFKSIKKFRGESLLSTWVYRITTNMCLDELRRRKKASFVYIDEGVSFNDSELELQLPTDAPGPQETVERIELKTAIEKALHILSEEQRMVIVLRDIQGFSYKEIARILRIPSGTVKSRVSRARTALKKVLQEKMELSIFEYVKEV